MATTRTYSGALQFFPRFQMALSGDAAGGAETPPTLRLAQTWNDAGGDDPSLSGWLYGEITVSAGDILLAHATDPFGSMGDAVYSDGLTVAGKKLKLLYLRNTDDANSVTVARKSSNGLPIFAAASDAIVLSPGSSFLYTDLGGDVAGALTTGSNDALTLTPSAGNPVLALLAVYGD